MAFYHHPYYEQSIMLCMEFYISFNNHIWDDKRTIIDYSYTFSHNMYCRTITYNKKICVIFKRNKYGKDHRIVSFSTNGN